MSHRALFVDDEPNVLEGIQRSLRKQVDLQMAGSGAQGLRTITAVNQGQIYRFLSEPCPAEQLLVAIADGLKHHRIITAERVPLKQTLAAASPCGVSLNQ